MILDPSSLDAKGGTAIDFYVPSRNGKYVAISLSKGGSESGDVHVYDTGTRQATGDVVPRVNGGTAGGSVAWNEAGDGFYYTRYPRDGERPAADMDFYQQVWFHKLGTKTEQDTYSTGKEFGRIAEIQLDASDDGRYILARVAMATVASSRTTCWVPRANGSRSRRLADEVSETAFGPDGRALLVVAAACSDGEDPARRSTSAMAEAGGNRACRKAP